MSQSDIIVSVQLRGLPITVTSAAKAQLIILCHINLQEYVSKNVNEIPADERFLYRFAAMKFEQKAGAETHADDDVESVNSDEFDLLLSTLSLFPLNFFLFLLVYLLCWLLLVS